MCIRDRIAHYSRTEGVPNYFFWSSTIEAMLFFSLGTLFNDPIKIEKHLSKLGGAVSCVICIIIAAVSYTHLSDQQHRL